MSPLQELGEAQQPPERDASRCTLAESRRDWGWLVRCERWSLSVLHYPVCRSMNIGEPTPGDPGAVRLLSHGAIALSAGRRRLPDQGIYSQWLYWCAGKSPALASGPQGDPALHRRLSKNSVMVL